MPATSADETPPAQLLIYYMRLTGPEGLLLQRCGAPGAALCKEAVSNAAFMLEIKRVLQVPR